MLKQNYNLKYYSTYKLPRFYKDTYSAGASHRIIKVPSSDAIVNNHKNKRSNTSATKPQSASSYMTSKRERKVESFTAPFT